MAVFATAQASASAAATAAVGAGGIAVHSIDVAHVSSAERFLRALQRAEEFATNALAGVRGARAYIPIDSALRRVTVEAVTAAQRTPVATVPSHAPSAPAATASVPRAAAAVAAPVVPLTAASSSTAPATAAASPPAVAANAAAPVSNVTRCDSRDAAATGVADAPITAVAATGAEASDAAVGIARARRPVAPEPPAGDANAATVTVRFPDGSRVQRRFAKSHTIADIRCFIESQVRSLALRVAQLACMASASWAFAK